MGGSRVERAEGGPPGGAPRPLRRPEGQGVTDGRPSPVALRRAAAERRGALLAHTQHRGRSRAGMLSRWGAPDPAHQSPGRPRARSSHQLRSNLRALPSIPPELPPAEAPRRRLRLRPQQPLARRGGMAPPRRRRCPPGPGASLSYFLRLTELLSGRSTPKSCTTTLLFRPRSFRGRHAERRPAQDADHDTE